MYKVVIGASAVTSVAFILAGCSHKQFDCSSGDSFDVCSQHSNCAWAATPNCTATAQFESACPVTKNDANVRSCRGFNETECSDQWTSSMGYKCMPFTKVAGDVFDKVESDVTGDCAQYDYDQQSCNLQPQCVFASNWNSTTGTRFSVRSAISKTNRIIV